MLCFLHVCIVHLDMTLDSMFIVAACETATVCHGLTTTDRRIKDTKWEDKPKSASSRFQTVTVMWWILWCYRIFCATGNFGVEPHCSDLIRKQPMVTDVEAELCLMSPHVLLFTECWTSFCFKHNRRPGVDISIKCSSVSNLYSTLSPSSPGGPWGPAGPGRPTGPWMPSRPAGPMGPFSPWTLKSVALPSNQHAQTLQCMKG